MGLIVLILSVPLFLSLLRFWDDCTDKQQAMDIEKVIDPVKNPSAAPAPQSTFSKNESVTCVKTPELQGTELSKGPISSKIKKKCFG